MTWQDVIKEWPGSDAGDSSDSGCEIVQETPIHLPKQSTSRATANLSHIAEAGHITLASASFPLAEANAKAKKEDAEAKAKKEDADAKAKQEEDAEAKAKKEDAEAKAKAKKQRLRSIQWKQPSKFSSAISASTPPAASTASAAPPSAAAPSAASAAAASPASAAAASTWSERRLEISRRMHKHHSQWLARQTANAQPAILARRLWEQQRRALHYHHVQAPANAAA